MLTDQPRIQISTFGNPYDVGKNQSQPQNQYTIFVIELNTTLNNFISHNREITYFGIGVSGSFMI